VSAVQASLDGVPGIGPIVADSGRDLVHGGDGNDQLFGGQGFDRVFGGRGDDFINVLDERGDVVECGRGNGDEVYADFQDTVSRFPEGHCENTVLIDVVPANAETFSSEELSALPSATVVEE
jgi:Ca2+-binding RTX toxin-like protein